MREIFALELLGIDKSFIKNLDVIYGMGPYGFNRFIISIVFLWLFFILLNRNKIKNQFTNFLLSKKIYKKDFYFITTLIFCAFLISFIYAIQYENSFTYFYPAVYSVMIFNPLVISLLFTASIILFYIFSLQILKQKHLAFVSSLLWIFSSMHLMNLFSSPLRDYIKAPLFILNFILIYILLNSLKNNFILFIFFSSIVYSSTIIFKTDLYLLFPVYLFVIIANNNIHFINRIFGLIIFSIISYFHIHLTYIPSRGFHRLGTSFSHEMFPTYNNLTSIGTWYDSTFIIQSCIAHNCDKTISFIYYLLSHIDEIITKTIITIKTIIHLPFSHGILPPINDYISNIFYLKLFVLKYVLFIENFYFITLLVFYSIYILFNKKIYHLYYLCFLCYIVFIYSLEFFGKHYFFLEIFSIILFIFLFDSLIKIIISGYKFKKNI